MTNLALGFALAYDAVDTAIVGTADPEHMKSNFRLVEEELLAKYGLMPPDMVAAAHRALGRKWDRLGGTDERGTRLYTTGYAL